jgi:hypothetical protein
MWLLCSGRRKSVMPCCAAKARMIWDMCALCPSKIIIAGDAGFSSSELAPWMKGRTTVRQ